MRFGLIPRLLLIFTLLVTQLGGLSHGVSHILSPETQDQSLPHEKHCDLCASYAQLGSALGSNQPPQFTAAKIGEVFAAPAPTFYHTASFAAFAARAPPHFV